MKSHFC